MANHDYDPLKATLDKMAHVHKYNKLIYDTIRPFLGKTILEIGAGIGNISSLLKNSGEELLILTDYKKDFVVQLTKKFNSDSRIKIMQLDISHDSHIDDTTAVDSIVCINVLEHIKDDVSALKNCNKLLCQKGKLILFVPAMRILYGSLDKSLGHYRRYTKKEVTEKLQIAGFEVISNRYFNIIGVLGWLLSAKILKKNMIPTSHLKLFEIITFIAKLEKYVHPPFGLSVLAVGEKKGSRL